MSEHFREDWKAHLSGYEIPTVLKDQLLGTYFETAKVQDPILDLGCGTGYFSELLARRGLDVTAIDEHGEYFPAGERRATYQSMSGAKLGFTDGTFASVLLINVLAVSRTNEERAVILREAKRVLQKGGRIYMVLMAEALADGEVVDDLLSAKVEGALISYDFKKTDGSRLRFLDNIIRQGDVDACIQAAGLQIKERKDFLHPTKPHSIYTLFALQ